MWLGAEWLNSYLGSNLIHVQYLNLLAFIHWTSGLAFGAIGLLLSIAPVRTTKWKDSSMVKFTMNWILLILFVYVFLFTMTSAFQGYYELGFFTSAYAQEKGMIEYDTLTNISTDKTYSIDISTNEGIDNLSEET